jgi:2-methylfumaryl-CoA hydratase
VATKGRDESMTLRHSGGDQDGKYADGVLLDLDYWALMPR